MNFRNNFEWCSFSVVRNVSNENLVYRMFNEWKYEYLNSRSRTIFFQSTFSIRRIREYKSRFCLHFEKNIGSMNHCIDKNTYIHVGTSCNPYPLFNAHIQMNIIQNDCLPIILVFLCRPMHIWSRNVWEYLTAQIFFLFFFVFFFFFILSILFS